MHEDPQAGPRPYLILTRDEAIPVMSGILAVPATRTVRGIPTEVPLDETDGMRFPCALTLDNTTVILKSLCTRRITRLGPEKMAAVCRALTIAAGC